MATLNGDITADAELIRVTGTPPPPGSYLMLEDEAIVFYGASRGAQGREFTRDWWSVERGVAGTTKASHVSGTTLIQYYPEAESAGGVPSSADLIAVYDEFSRYPDGSISASVPIVGSAWQSSGSQPPTVASGLLTSSGTGYVFQVADEPVSYVECTAVFSGTDDGTLALAFGWGDSTLDSLVHLIVGGTGGFTLTVRKDGGSFDGILFSTSWKGHIAFDGTTLHKFAMYVRGETVVVVGPDGEVFATADARIAELAGSSVFWEPLTGTYASKIASVRAVSRDPVEIAVANGPSEFDLTPVGNDFVYAFRDMWDHVEIGQHAVSGLPAITFGPTRIRTTLVGAISIGATSIRTRDRMFDGSTLIGYGDDAETVTVSSAAASAPFTATITAAAKDHADGAYVEGGGNPTGIRPYLDFNPSSWLSTFSGYLNLLQRLSVNGNQVVTDRHTGWTAASGTAARTTFDTGTVTTEELAKRVKALLDDLIDHGLIGT